MTAPRIKYPRTPHLPWSPGIGADDRVWTDVSALADTEIVVTEKLDGENTTLYPDGLHARAIDGRHHPSQDWVRALQGRIGYRIPAGWRLCGENLYAVHSLRYTALAGYFYLFAVWDDSNQCLSWDETLAWAHELDLPTPAELYRGRFDRQRLADLAIDTQRMEGYVLRRAGRFAFAAFADSVAKWVRPGHVVTDSGWRHQRIEVNQLAHTA